MPAHCHGRTQPIRRRPAGIAQSWPKRSACGRRSRHLSLRPARRAIPVERRQSPFVRRKLRVEIFVDQYAQKLSYKINFYFLVNYFYFLFYYFIFFFVKFEKKLSCFYFFSFYTFIKNLYYFKTHSIIPKTQYKINFFNYVFLVLKFLFFI